LVFFFEVISELTLFPSMSCLLLAFSTEQRGTNSMALIF